MAEKISVMIATVILVVIAAILYPLVGTQVADLTDNTSDNYVGDDTAPIEMERPTLSIVVWG